MAQPTMTATDARRFEAVSETSAAQVLEAFECGCEPYADVFTFNRWKAQGFAVRKGEKAFRLASYVKSDRQRRSACGELFTVTKTRTTCPKCGDEGTPAGALIPRTIPVFCRCQVDEDGR